MAGCCGGSVRGLSNTDIFGYTLSVILKQVVSESGLQFHNIVKHSGVFLFFCLCHMNTTGSLVPIGTCIQGTTCRQDGIRRERVVFFFLILTVNIKNSPCSHLRPFQGGLGHRLLFFLEEGQMEKSGIFSLRLEKNKQ